MLKINSGRVEQKMHLNPWSGSSLVFKFKHWYAIYISVRSNWCKNKASIHPWSARLHRLAGPDIVLSPGRILYSLTGTGRARYYT